MNLFILCNHLRYTCILSISLKSLISSAINIDLYGSMCEILGKHAKMRFEMETRMEKMANNYGFYFQTWALLPRPVMERLRMH